MSRTHELVKNTVIITIGKLATLVVNFLLLPLYTSKLSTEEYGNYDFVVVISSFLVPIITLLLEESMFRFIIDAKTEKETGKVISNTLFFCVFSSIVLCALGGILTYVFNYELGLYIVVYAVALVMIALSNAITRAKGKVTLYSCSNFALSVLIIALNLIMILIFNMGFEALVLSHVIANVLVSLIVFKKISIGSYIKLKSIDRNLLKQMLKYSLPLVPNTICWNVIELSDRLLIMSVLGASFNGVYSIANKFPNVINTFYSYFIIAWRESSAKILNDGNEEESYNSIYKTIKKVLFSVTLGLICVIPLVFPILVNEEYLAGMYYIPILAVSVYFLALSSFYGGVFTAHKDTKVLGTTSVIGALINLLINAILISKFKLYAAAFSTLIASIVMYSYRKIKVKKHITFHEEISNDIIQYILIGVACISFYINSNYLNVITFIISLTFIIIYNKNILLMVLKWLRRKVKK